jgi:hypothetical protein
MYSDLSKPILVEDFGCLMSDKALHSSIIDACISALTWSANRNDIFIATTLHTSQILRSPFSESFSLNDEELSGKNKILFPCNIDNKHWTLFCVDLAEQICYDINPDEHCNEAEELLQKFQKYITRRNLSRTSDKINARHLKCRSKKRTIQTGNNDCGAYVLHYMSKILYDQPLDDFVDIVEFRVYMGNLLLDMAAVSQPTITQHTSLAFHRYNNGLFAC